jgi:DNA-binding transcriptional MerR regulator
MDNKRVLALDMSTKTGWALSVSSNSGIKLEKYGQILKTSEPLGQYPKNYVDWANQVFGEILGLINELKPDVLVIEETASGSRNIYSQKILEWIHFLVAKYIKEYSIEAVYMLTEQWRRETGCQMTKDESKRNKEVREYKKSKEKETGTKPTAAYDINGKRIGLISRKHVNVRRANEVFGAFLKEPLRQKDEDTADSLLLGYAYHLRRVERDKKDLVR